MNNQVEEVIRTNALGTLIATRAAARRMLRQPASTIGHIFLMEVWAYDAIGLALVGGIVGEASIPIAPLD